MSVKWWTIEWLAWICSRCFEKQVFPQVVVKNANEATMAGSNKITLLKQIQVGVFFSFFLSFLDLHKVAGKKNNNYSPNGGGI